MGKFSNFPVTILKILYPDCPLSVLSEKQPREPGRIVGGRAVKSESESGQTKRYL